MSISTAAVKNRPWAQPLSRPVITSPNLAVVPSPVPRRGFALTVVICIALFASALLLSFYLNTRMVQGAYEIKAVKIELSDARIQEESLEAQAVQATSAQALQRHAATLGMEPAGSVRQLDLDAGTLSAVSE